MRKMYHNPPESPESLSAGERIAVCWNVKFWQYT